MGWNKHTQNPPIRNVNPSSLATPMNYKDVSSCWSCCCVKERESRKDLQQDLRVTSTNAYGRKGVKKWLSKFRCLCNHLRLVQVCIHLFIAVNKFLLLNLAIAVSVEQVEGLLQLSLLFLWGHVRYHKRNGSSLQFGFGLKQINGCHLPWSLSNFQAIV